MYEIKNSNIIKIKIQDPLLKMKGVFSFKNFPKKIIFIINKFYEWKFQ